MADTGNQENCGVRGNLPPGNIALPAFALKHAAVNVSLSTSVSSELSVLAGDTQYAAAAPHPLQAASVCSAGISGQPQVQPNNPKETQQPTVLQLLSQLDSIKWENVANWAAKDSAEAAALCDKLIPIMAESVVSQFQLGDEAILRLEAQVAKKKLVSKAAVAEPD